MTAGIFSSVSLPKVTKFRINSVRQLNSIMALQQVSSYKMFGGYQKVFTHHSKELACDMKFGIYLPTESESRQVPVLYWLSGLTCTEENFVTKAGAQKYAAEHNICIVCPDTSPRNVNLPGENDSYDFGSGAGFYLNASQDPWKKHYRMFDYVCKELISLVTENFPTVPGKQSICGHSMGGHGALICALKNPGLYSSVSAFAPISNPINAPWGQKAFKGYLGDAEDTWKEWDATELSGGYDGVPMELFIDQGTEDDFYKQKQLLPENLVAAAARNDRLKCVLKMREGYDHSYYYIASFIGEHVEYHAKFLNV